MNFVKRITAAGLAAVLALTMTACHQAREVVASYDDIEITGGMYLAMLLEADSNARTLVTEQSASGGETASAVSDYNKATVSTDDGEVKYYNYVTEEAKKLIRQYIATEVLSKEYNVTLSDEDQTGLDAYVTYYWDSYGYSAMYEPNGIGRESYTAYMRNAGYLRGNLFSAIYGKDGKTPVSEADIKDYMNKNYCIANIISESLSSTDSEGNTVNLTDAEKTELLKKLNGYAERLNKGEKFETIYHEDSGTTHEEEHDHSDETADTSSNTASENETAEKEEETLEPLDSHATLLNSKETGNESENFTEIYKMKVGEVKVIETETSYSLVVKGDISADPYYLDSLDLNIRQLLKSDEFNKLLEDKGNELDIKFNEGEIRYLSPKKINYDIY